jgi:hypothetical protein
MNRLPAAQRILLYGVLLGLLATGVVWEALDRGPAASFVMKIHGALAMAVLIVVGTLLAHHVPAGWATLKNRWSGICLLAILAWLAASGYLLYYSGSESLRTFASQSHLWIGVAAAIVVGWHIRRSAIP